MVSDKKKEELEQELLWDIADGNKKDIAYILGRKIIYPKTTKEKIEAEAVLEKMQRWFESTDT
jgi:hypothetical protein